MSFGQAIDTTPGITSTFSVPSNPAARIIPPVNSSPGAATGSAAVSGYDNWSKVQMPLISRPDWRASLAMAAISLSLLAGERYPSRS